MELKSKRTEQRSRHAKRMSEKQEAGFHRFNMNIVLCLLEKQWASCCTKTQSGTSSGRTSRTTTWSSTVRNSWASALHPVWLPVKVQRHSYGMTGKRFMGRVCVWAAGFFEMKMKYDESDNAFIRASRAVTDRMTDLIGERLLTG